jgi:hypothetical protein
MAQHYRIVGNSSNEDPVSKFVEVQLQVRICINVFLRFGNHRAAIDTSIVVLDAIGRILTRYDIENIASLFDSNIKDNMRFNTREELEIEAQISADILHNVLNQQRICKQYGEAVFQLAAATLGSRGKASESDIETAKAAGMSDEQIDDVIRTVVMTVLSRHLEYVGGPGPKIPCLP